MSELHARARILYNALNFDTPVNFGQEELFPKGLGEDKYVDSLHGPADRDPVQELANQIDLSDSTGAYLFTGNRGTGKTTELLRLATILREYDCEVFYADMADYLTLTQRIEVSDFLISVLGAFSEKIAGRFTADPGKPSFFERLQSFLNANVQFTEVKGMREVVGKRLPQWRDFFTEAQLQRLAQHSGGDLRDYLRMLRLTVARLLQSGQLPVPEILITDAEDAVRGDMLPIADNDRAWLHKIMASHKPELPSLDALPDFARLQEGKYLLHYRNGEDWYDVHPLLRAEVKNSGNKQPGA
jgi:hypothetical protein